MADSRCFITDCWINEHSRRPPGPQTHDAQQRETGPRVHTAAFVPKQDRTDLCMGKIVKALGQVDLSESFGAMEAPCQGSLLHGSAELQEALYLREKKEGLLRGRAAISNMKQSSSSGG